MIVIALEVVGTYLQIGLQKYYLIEAGLISNMCPRKYWLTFSDRRT